MFVPIQAPLKFNRVMHRSSSLTVRSGSTKGSVAKLQTRRMLLADLCNFIITTLASRFPLYGKDIHAWHGQGRPAYQTDLIHVLQRLEISFMGGVMVTTRLPCCTRICLPIHLFLRQFDPEPSFSSSLRNRLDRNDYAHRSS